MELTEIANWGNYPTVRAEVSEFTGVEELKSKLQHSSASIIRGSGLSYGDASLGAHILSSLKFNKIIAFDSKEGIMTTEAGTTLDQILQVIVPSGWFLPVTPGTKFITVGGAVAGDVHGKNHHGEGSFCRYVTELQLMMADGTITVCGPTTHPDLFNTVCGGLGLSAVILTVKFRLKKISTSFIRQQNVIIHSLEEMLEKLRHFGSSTYSVSWIDCLARGAQLGRGVLMLGEHATPAEVNQAELLRAHKPPSFTAPFFFPPFILNSFTIRTFNFLFFHKHRIASKEAIVHYDPYFYPLDFIKGWNKLYGKPGFLQYQFVIPFENSAKGLRIILKAISESGLASFLAVLKAMGPGEHTLSFPIPGYTLALDFPVSKNIFPLLDKLDKIVVELGGRIYLVKDARMDSATYWGGYKNATVFKEQVNRFDPHQKFSSLLSQRLRMI